jgi:hypothetical protein
MVTTETRDLTARVQQEIRNVLRFTKQGWLKRDERGRGLGIS